MAVQIGYTCPGASSLPDAVSGSGNLIVIICKSVPSPATDVTLFLNFTHFSFSGAVRGAFFAGN